MDTTLDPNIIALTRAIKKNETGEGDTYNTPTGKDGEQGAYRFLPATWKTWAGDTLGDPNAPMTMENQNKVAYAQVKKYKDQGYNPGQIASLWNHGTPDPTGVVGVSKGGASYDTPAYVNKVYADYQKYKGQTPTATTQPTDTTQPEDQAKSPTVDQQQPDDGTYGATFKASENDNPLKAGLKSLGNVPSSLLNMGKSLFSAVTHPINTIKGIGNAFAGGVEEGFNALAGEPGAANKQTETFDALKNALAERYGSIAKAQKTATNDPIGFGADVFSILEGGAAILDVAGGTTAADLARNVPETLGGEQGAGFTSDINAGSATHPSPTYTAPTQGKFTGALDKAVSTVGGPVSDTIGNVIGAPAKIGAKILGQSTGSGSEAIKTGFNAAAEGGDASKAFTDALRGNTSLEDLVNKARGALDQVVDTRRSNYKKMLGSLKSDTSELDTTPLKTQVDKSLDNFNIKRTTAGKLDFSESTIARPSDQQDIQSMVNDVDNWKNNSPEGIDTLKQRLSNYWEPGSKTGAFSESLRSTARGIIEKTPGYSDAMKNYSEMSEQIKDIKQSLSLGDKASIETSFNKLKNALNNDKQFRQAVIDDLDVATGGTLRQSIAGQKMSKLAPSGLAKYADIGGLGTAIAHGTGILPMLGLAITTSPRIVGEFVNALGIGARGTKIVMKYLNKFATPIVAAGSAASK